MDLWERGLHTVLAGGTEVEGSAREGMFARVGEEEEEALDSKFRITVLSGNVCQNLRQATNRGGGSHPAGYMHQDRETNRRGPVG